MFSVIAILLFSYHSKANATGNIKNFIFTESKSTDTIVQDHKDSTNFKGKLDHFNDVMENVIKYSPLPVVSYSTETDWLFGLTKINAFRIGAKDQNDTLIQPSHITATAYLTLNDQYKVVLTSDLMFGHNKYESFTELLFMDFPNYYYGIGDETKLSDECLVETENFSITQSFGYKISKSWYVGLKYNYNNYFKVDTVPSSKPCTEDVSHLERNEGVQSGIGLRVSRETRDNRFNARSGSFSFFEYMNYGTWIGSNFAYHSLILDLRKYISPANWLTVAGQFYAEAKFGDVPIQSLALMGGDNRMRGIYIGRFRDKTMMEGQLELRFPIYWIFGGTVFTGLGEVAPDFGAYTWEGIKWTYGAGIRMNVNKATRTNIRFDVGFFEHKPLFFFTFSEAF